MSLIKRVYHRYFTPLIPVYQEGTKQFFLSEEIVKPWSEQVLCADATHCTILTSALSADLKIDILSLSEVSSLIEAGLEHRTDQISIDQLRVARFYFNMDGQTLCVEHSEPFAIHGRASHLAISNRNVALNGWEFRISTKINLESGVAYSGVVRVDKSIYVNLKEKRNESINYLGFTLEGFRTNVV